MQHVHMKSVQQAPVEAQSRAPVPTRCGPRPAQPRAPVWSLARASNRAQVQAKLSMRTPGDALEVEADRVATQAMTSPAKSGCGCGGSCSCATTGSVQRAEAPGVTVGSALAAVPASAQAAPSSVERTVSSGGRPLAAAVRADMEPRFGRDLGHVRVHTDGAAARSATDIGALAYTVGEHIVFAHGRYAPSSTTGKALLAHELVHTMQQERDVVGRVVQRYGGCTSAQDTMVAADHTRALAMVRTAIGELLGYNGTTPAKVHTALSTHFGGATSAAFGAWIMANLTFLIGVASDSYECYTGGIIERGWACSSPGTRATTFWCVPGVDIRLCPSYLADTDGDRRSLTLIHEWVHKYGCNFDLGYEHDPEYSGNSTLTQLLNADSFENFVRDVQ